MRVLQPDLRLRIMLPLFQSMTDRICARNGRVEDTLHRQSTLFSTLHLEQSTRRTAYPDAASAGETFQLGDALLFV